MILVDANLLVYCYYSAASEHVKARTWIDEQFSGPTRIAMPWETINAFVRIVSNPRIFSRPVDVMEAWAQVEAWIAEPNVWIPTPTSQHATLMAELCRSGTFVANDVPDLHLAALAISHGLKLASHDGGFARFDGLRWFDPLAA